MLQWLKSTCFTGAMSPAGEAMKMIAKLTGAESKTFRIPSAWRSFMPDRYAASTGITPDFVYLAYRSWGRGFQAKNCNTFTVTN